MTHGVVSGSFLPYHVGHAHRIRAMRAQVDALTVLVCSSADDPIPGGERFRWVRAAHPDCRVVHVAEPPSAAVIARHADPGDVVVSVDDALEAAILERPMAHWAEIAEQARAYFVRRVALVGPESVGKSTLAERLARDLGTAWVPEYGRRYCEGIDALALDVRDLEAIAWGQATWEDDAALRANRVLLCDTELHTTCTWTELTVGWVPAWMTAAARGRPYDLFLMLEPDVPWVADDVRVLADRRAGHADMIRRELEAAGRRVVTVRGDWDARARHARAAIDALLAEPGPPARR